jgi:hypothetical protein
VKVYLDEEPPAPPRGAPVRTAHECIHLLASHTDIDELSLDHDLGEDAGTGYDVLLWLERTQQLYSSQWACVPNVIHIHTANVSARVKMELAVESINRLRRENL